VDIAYVRSRSNMLSQIHGEKCWPTVDKVSPCEEACPIHMDVPSYVIAIAQGKFKEALDIVRETNPFPSICGRVCHHPCEDACARGFVDRPIAIEWLKRFVGEYEQTKGTKPRRSRRKLAEKVAIIGSGPAGLTTAYDLARLGYQVCVYEALPVAGGMLAAGIPEFMLSKDIVAAEVKYIEDTGVEIKTDMRVGRDVTLADLKAQGFKAILLASGAWKSIRLGIPGEDLKRVLPALPFLRDARLGEKTRLKGTVGVIGGGNVALDAARTALRLGAKKVFLACLESRSDMPAYDWEVAAAEEEGVEMRTALAPQRFVSRKGKKVSRIDFRNVTSTTRDDEGRMSWTLDEGPDSDQSVEVDSVIVAIGQAPDPSFVEGVVTAGGAFSVDPETMATNVPGIFAAGDAVKAPGTIVEAIAHGHGVAQSIDRFLKGKDLKRRRRQAPKEVIEIEEDAVPSFLAKRDRWDMPALSQKDAVRSFEETELGYSAWQAVAEARRCMNCRMCGNCVFGRGQICLETSSRLLAVN